MDSDEGNKQKENRYNLSSDSNLSKPIWVRYSGIQIKPIDQRLLYASALLFFGLFLYFFKINPITYFKFKIKTIKELLKSKFNKNGQNL